jgi:hypothetical protein
VAEDNPAARPARTSRVVVVRDSDVNNDGNRVKLDVVKKMLDDALLRVTGQKTPKDAWLSLLKPNDVVGLVPTYGASGPGWNPNNTHTEFVAAVEESLAAAGFPKDRVRNVQLDIKLAAPCTSLINLPALKTHWLTGIGTTLKNYIMFSGKPTNYHREQSVKLGEIWHLPAVEGKTKLILVDALYPLCDKGPQPDPRYRWAYNGILASVDPVAADAVGLRIVGRKRDAMRGEPWPISPPPLCVAAADERYHLGTSRWNEIKLETIGWQKDLLL